MNRACAWIIGVAAVVPLSCTGTDVGNGFVDVGFKLYDSGTAQGGESAGVAPPGLAVTDAWMTAERIRLRDAARCDGATEAEFLGPFAVDLLAPGTPPALRALEVPFIDYCRFELRWDALEPDEAVDAPRELVGASLLIAGTRQDGTPFILRSERGDDLRLEAVTGAFSIVETTRALFVGFDVQTLFDGVDVDGAEVGNDGVIRIEDGSNEDLLAVFDDNLADAAKLFDDDDDDRELDPEERGDAHVLAE